MGTGKLGSAGCKTVVMSVLIGMFSPPSYFGEVPYGDSGTTLKEDAASVSLHLGEIDETSKTAFPTYLNGNKSTLTIGNFELVSVKNLDAYSDASAEEEVRTSYSVLMILIIV